MFDNQEIPCQSRRNSSFTGNDVCFASLDLFTSNTWLSIQCCLCLIIGGFDDHAKIDVEAFSWICRGIIGTTAMNTYARFYHHSQNYLRTIFLWENHSTWNSRSGTLSGISLKLILLVHWAEIKVLHSQVSDQQANLRSCPVFCHCCKEFWSEKYMQPLLTVIYWKQGNCTYSYIAYNQIIIVKSEGEARSSWVCGCQSCWNCMKVSKVGLLQGFWCLGWMPQVSYCIYMTFTLIIVHMH